MASYPGSASSHARLAEIPRAARESPDFQSRVTFSRHSYFARGGYEVQCFERLKLIQFIHRAPSELEMAFARRASEVDYVRRLGHLVHDMEGSPMVADLPRDSVCLQRVRRVLSTGVPTGRESLDEYNYRPHVKLRKFERRMRHTHEVYVAYHQREVLAMAPEAVVSKYPRFASWWSDYEVPYGFYPEMPPIISYLGLELRYAKAFWMWELFRIEWARECAIELIYEAREGKLWWLPPAVIDTMNQYGLETILPDETEEVIGDLHGLLREIRLIRWDLVPVDQRKLPRNIGGYCPVYANGDWVAFNPNTWESYMEDGMYLRELNVDPRGWPVGRGVRQTGNTDSWVQEDAPDGREEELFRRAAPGSRIAERFGLSRSELTRANRVMRTIADNVGLTAAVQNSNMNWEWDLRFLIREATRAVRGEAAFGQAAARADANKMDQEQHGSSVVEEEEIVPEMDISEPIGYSGSETLAVHILPGPARIGYNAEENKRENEIPPEADGAPADKRPRIAGSHRIEDGSNDDVEVIDVDALDD